MTREVVKEHERKLLIKRIFPTPFAGHEHTLVLFQTCRDLGDQYCLSFDEKGHTSDYKPFDSEEVIDRVVKLLTDDRLRSHVERDKTVISEYHDFRGKYYTYDHKTKSLKLESEWEELETMLDEFAIEYRKDGKAVLCAIREANVKLDKKSDNWFIIRKLAKKHGYKKGWFEILASLEIIGIIQRHKGDLWVPEELIPLVENVLERWKDEGGEEGKTSQKSS